jgi:predicted 2-oxoglutarate/Fe(II)-dependent dioxygenase YbiX
VEILPCHEISPAYPFGGFVMNFNVSTLIHRDWKDLNLCMVIVISENYQGGELALLEPGVLLELRNGDMVIFPSSKISHFNMHYSGERASLVFHTDSAAKSWIKDRNGWAKNIHFRSTVL